MKKRTAKILISLVAVVFVLCEGLVLGFALSEREVPEISLPPESSAPITVTVNKPFYWIDLFKQGKTAIEYSNQPAECTLEEFPGKTFVFDGKNISVIVSNGKDYQLPALNPFNIIFADVTGDGFRDVCFTFFEIYYRDPHYSFVAPTYKIGVYDLVTGITNIMQSPTDMGHLVFRLYDDQLYVVSYAGSAEAEFYSGVYFDTETTEILMELVTPGYEIKSTLLYSPVQTGNCLYTYKEGTVNEIDSYYLLTDEDVDIINKINTGITWEEQEFTYGATDDVYFEPPLFYIRFTEGTVHVYSNGSIVVTRSNMYYYAGEGGEKLYDYILYLSESSLPYMP